MNLMNESIYKANLKPLGIDPGAEITVNFKDTYTLTEDLKLKNKEATYFLYEVLKTGDSLITNGRYFKL